MGVPVVMLQGQTYASRFGGSVLANVGLEDLIANSAEEYVDRAVALGRRPGSPGRACAGTAAPDGRLVRSWISSDSRAIWKRRIARCGSTGAEVAGIFLTGFA